MEDFQQQVAFDAVRNLKNLQKNLQSAEKIPDSQRREIFRTLHTIKGTAQTFGFSDAGRLAHELENILAAETSIESKIFQLLFTEGIGFLINSFEQKNFDFPAHFAEKIHRTIPENNQLQTSSEIFLPEIPREIVEFLSQSEKAAIDSALKNGQHIYCFEVAFDTANFAGKLIECRADLAETGEIIATFPNAKSNRSGTIGFRILCACSAKKVNIEAVAEIYDAEITFDISSENFTNDLRGIIGKAVAHGRDLAKKLGKKVNFTISVEETNISDEKLKIVFDVLIHLIRNAVDHGIEESGKVEIDLKAKKNGMNLIVADDGNGINPAKLKAKALEKNLISADDILTEQAAFDLVFQPELSTAPQITEISGRGIGLDAVKTAVENSGGTIKVTSRIGKGTIFEVFLPQ